MKWNIYYESREFARSLNDPCLGIVEADSKQEAEEKARNGEWRTKLSEVNVVGGFWAVSQNAEELIYNLFTDENKVEGLIKSLNEEAEPWQEINDCDITDHTQE